MKSQVLNTLLILVLFGLNSLISSCSKTNDDEIIKTPTPIIAGWHDTTDYFYQFPTPISLNLVMDNSMHFSFAQDTISLQFGNDHFDLCVRLQVINPDSLVVIMQNEILLVSYFQVLSTESLRFAVEYNNCGIGHGQYTTFTYVKAFNYNEAISSNSNWTANNNSEKWQNLYEYPTPADGLISGFTGGPWKQPASNFHYIGFSYQNHFGWIKVDMSDVRNPKFVSYAIKK